MNRINYCAKPTDSEEVKDIKDIMNLICDKIEDTELQMKEKGSYEAEKRKMIE